jgi:hypothetical protein
MTKPERKRYGVHKLASVCYRTKQADDQLWTRACLTHFPLNLWAPHLMTRTPRTPRKRAENSRVTRNVLACGRSCFLKSRRVRRGLFRCLNAHVVITFLRIYLPTWFPMTPPIAAPPSVPNTPPPVSTAPPTAPTPAPTAVSVPRLDIPLHPTIVIINNEAVTPTKNLRILHIMSPLVRHYGDLTRLA